VAWEAGAACPACDPRRILFASVAWEVGAADSFGAAGGEAVSSALANDKAVSPTVAVTKAEAAQFTFISFVHMVLSRA
jgi:hypothetical protein